MHARRRDRILGGARHRASTPTALAAATVVALASCGSGLEGPPVVLTVAGPMSGPASFQGRAMADAVRLAAEQVDAEGGIAGRPVEVRVVDDGNDPARGKAAAEASAKDGATLAVIGHRASDVCLAAGPVYREAGLPALTASATDPAVTADNPFYFRAVFDNDAQGRFLAAYARHGLGLAKVGLVNAGRSLVESFRPGAAAVGLTLAGEWSFDPKASDPAGLAALAQAAKACAECQGFVLLANELPARDAIRALRDAGVKGPILAGQAVGREGFADLFAASGVDPAKARAYTDDLYAVAVALPDTGGETMQAFRRAYRERFGAAPDTSAAAYYDAARMALAAARSAAVTGEDLAADRRRLRDALAAFGGPDEAFAGASGRLYFDARRSAVRPIAVGSFVHGVLTSAPVQLELLADPSRVPDADERLAAGTVVRAGGETFAKVQVVYVGLDVTAITDIDSHAGTFGADLFVWFRFRGDFAPRDLELATAAAPIDLGEPLWVRQRGPFTIATYRVKATFAADFDFHDYPFDTQSLRVELRPRARTTASLVLALDRLGMETADGSSAPREKLAGALGSTTWKLRDAVAYQDAIRSQSTLGEVGLRAADAGLVYSRVSAVVTIGRDVATYGLRNLLPLLIIIIVLYIGWFLPPEELGTRSSIAITALLTVTVLYQQLTAELPSVGYLVTMDYGFYTACALAMYATLVAVFVFLAARAGRRDVARRLDLSGRVVTPLALVVVTVLAFVRYG